MFVMQGQPTTLHAGDRLVYRPWRGTIAFVRQSVQMHYLRDHLTGGDDQYAIGGNVGIRELARAFADACGLVAREFKEHEERDRGAIYYDFYAPGTLKDEA